MVEIQQFYSLNHPCPVSKQNYQYARFVWTCHTNDFKSCWNETFINIHLPENIGQSQPNQDDQYDRINYGNFTICSMKLKDLRLISRIYTNCLLTNQRQKFRNFYTEWRGTIGFKENKQTYNHRLCGCRAIFSRTMHTVASLNVLTIKTST